MNVLFISSGNSSYDVVPFIKVQGESIKAEGVHLEYLTIKGKGISGYLKHRSKIKEESKKFDVIHAHYGLIGLLVVLSFTRKPIVLSVMGDDAYGSYNTAGKRILKSYIIMFLTQLAIIWPKALIVKSKNILKYIPYKGKTNIIANGVNFSIFKPLSKETCRTKLGLAQDKKILLALANPTDARKNFVLVQDAVKTMNDATIELVNPFPIKHHEFATYLNACDAFILTSYNEGSPNVIKEAMACNIPVISTNVGDVAQVIGNTEGCFLVDFNVNDVADKIKLALNFNNETTGRVDINHLDSRVVAKRIIAIYNSILRVK